MDSNTQNGTLVNCPICNESFNSTSLPLFCPRCAWDFKTDPTIHVSIEPMSEEELKVYNQRISLGRRNWERLQAYQKEAQERLTSDTPGSETLVLAYLAVERAKHFEEKGNYSEAVIGWTKVIDIDPNATNYKNRGDAYWRLRNYRKAIEDYTWAIEIQPDARLYHNRATAYNKINERDKAVADREMARAMEREIIS